MTRSLALLMMLGLFTGSLLGQSTASTPKPGSAERKAIMAALRPSFEKQAGKPVIFEVKYLKVSGGWAMFEGEPKRPGGKPIDWSKTKLADAWRDGVLDSISFALLQKKSGKWKVVELAIGPTDYPVEYWMQQHKSAPRSIFRQIG